MSRSEPRTLLDGLVFPEGPRWRDGRLIFSDMHGHEVRAVDLEGRHETIVRVPGQPSGLGWLPDGTMLVVSMKDRRVLAHRDSALSLHADISSIAPVLANDMLVDARGRAYVGNFGFDLYAGESPAPTKLALVEPDGSARVAASDLAFPNGMVLTPDGKTLVVAETFGMRLTAFEVAASGELSNRREWAPLLSPPDGICLDAEGRIWVAVPLNPGAFLRVAEGGAIEERIDLADHGGYACMLGGPDGRSLFLCEAKDGLPRNMQPGNGRIRVLTVDVPSASILSNRGY